MPHGAEGAAPTDLDRREEAVLDQDNTEVAMPDAESDATPGAITDSGMTE